MTHEESVAAEFARAVTWAPDLQSRVLIGGLPYLVGEVMTDMMDVSGHDYNGEIITFLTAAARDGNEQAQAIVKRMGETFAYLRCPPEPEPEEAPELRYQDRGEYDMHTMNVLRAAVVS